MAEDRTAEQGRTQPPAMKLSDSELVKLWVESGRDPIRFAQALEKLEALALVQPS